jgi:hypothetical protein
VTPEVIVGAFMPASGFALMVIRSRLLAKLQTMGVHVPVWKWGWFLDLDLRTSDVMECHARDLATNWRLVWAHDICFAALLGSGLVFVLVLVP